MKDIKKIPLAKIISFKDQSFFDEESLKDLALTIKEKGIVQPLVLTKSEDSYNLISGERVYLAALLNGLEEIEAIILDNDDEKSLNLAILENMQGSNLSAIEEAMMIKKIMDSEGLTQSQIAKRLGYKQSTIANKLRLLKLPDYIKNAIIRKQISERHARALLKVDDKRKEEVFLTLINRGYNVKKSEEYIKALDEKKHEKGVSNNIKIGLNTIKEAYELCRKSGLDADYQLTEYKDEIKITIRFKK